MLFNQDKCKCLHIGRTNGKSDYKMQNAMLNKMAIKAEGTSVLLYIHADLKVAEHLRGVL